MNLNKNQNFTLSDELALIKIKRAKKCFLGFKQSLRAGATEIFVSSSYAKKQQDAISKNLKVTFYTLSKSFFERYSVENKRYHPVNVIGVLQ